MDQKAFSNVSADYDEIEIFYDKLAKFLDQLSVIDSKPPSDAAFQRCITRVFSHQLDVLGIAQQYAEKESKHHFRRAGGCPMPADDPLCLTSWLTIP